MPSANLDLNYGMIFSCPPVVAMGESVQLRIMLSGGIGSLADFVIQAMFPNGEVKDVTVEFVLAPAASGPGFITYVRNFAFIVPGHYSFLIHRTTAGLERQWMDSMYCAEWASRIDVPVSQLGRQRSDIQRVYSRVNSNK
jgi:hypothetical protein